MYLKIVLVLIYLYKLLLLTMINYLQVQSYITRKNCNKIIIITITMLFMDTCTCTMVGNTHNLMKELQITNKLDELAKCSISNHVDQKKGNQD